MVLMPPALWATVGVDLEVWSGSVDPVVPFSATQGSATGTGCLMTFGYIALVFLGSPPWLLSKRF